MIDRTRFFVLIATVAALASVVVMTADGADSAATDDGLSYIIMGDSAFVSEYSGTSPVVNIPSTVTIDGTKYNVIGINDRVFSNNSNVVEIIIPESIQIIGNSAIYNCSNLKYVSIMGSPEIGSSFLFGCTNLELIEIGANIALQQSSFIQGPSSLSVFAHNNATINDLDIDLDYITEDSLIKFIPVGAPDTVGDIGFVATSPGQTISIPESAAVDGYDISMTVNGEAVESITAEAGSTTVVLNYTLREYHVEFKNGDTTVQSATVRHGETITAPAEVPTKEQDAQYTYTFSGWDGFTEGMVATGDVTFQAEFTETLRTYSVTFIVDGQTYLSQTLEYGAAIILPEDPVKESSEGVDYRFDGWDGYAEGVTVSSDHTFTARFLPTTHEYTISFVVDGEVFSESKLHFGDVITAPEGMPTKESDSENSYTFSGWYEFTEGMTVSGDMTFEATFDPSPLDDGSDGSLIAIAIAVIMVIAVLAVLLARRFL